MPNGLPTRLLELTEEMKECFDLDFDRRVIRAFREGLSAHCLKAVWEQVDRFRLTRIRSRTVRSVKQKVSKVTQSEVAECLGMHQGNASRMLSGESQDAGLLFATMSALGMEFDELRLPPRPQRLAAGYQAALIAVRTDELKESSESAPPSFWTVACLRTLLGNHKWYSARANLKVPDQSWELEKVALEIQEAAGEWIPPRQTCSATDLLKMERAWGKSMLLVVSALEAGWEDA